MKFNDLSRKKAPAYLVHKHRDDDVFLFNCRAALPAWFQIRPANIEQLNEEDEKSLYACYKRCDTGPDNKQASFCLKNLPWTIASGTDLHGTGMSAGWLEKYYEEIPGGYRLHQSNTPENVQVEIAAAISLKIFSESERYRASLVLEKIGVTCGAQIMHCSAYNDTKHYYFYGKRHEHVPGIMLMEFARQAFYAHFYRFSEKTRETVNLSILTFNCTFDSYLQSNYPIHISVETVWQEMVGTTRERQLLRAVLRQRGEIACVIEMCGSAIQSKLFARLRDVKTPKEEAFEPISQDASISLLLSSDSGQVYEAKIDLVCADTLIVKLADAQHTIPTDMNCKFHMFTQHQGVIGGDGVLAMDDPRALNGTTAIRVVNWNRGAAERYRDFLKMDCYLSESMTALAQ